MYNRNYGAEQAQTVTRTQENVGANSENDLDAIYLLLDHTTVLLPVERGGKRPLRKAWTEIGFSDTQNPDYIHDLKTNNVAVVLGPSSGNLVSVDCDDDAFMQAFEKANPDSLKTLRTKGERGCQFWFRMTGDYPPSVQKVQGNDGNHVGEFRSKGGCSIIAGIHPSGVAYQILNPVPPLEIPFEAIKWPKGYSYPWIPSEDEEIAKREGPAFTTNDHGVANKINAAFFAEWAKSRLDLIFDEGRSSFFLYNPDNGLWEQRSDIAICEPVWNCCNEWVDSQDGDLRESLKMLFTQKIRLDIVALLKTKVLESGFFDEGPFRRDRNGIFHTTEGMCVWNAEATFWSNAFHEIPFLKDFRSLHQFPCRLVEKPQCPMFESLLNGLVGKENREFMHKFLGYLLIEGNPGQHVGVIKGPSGLGKSQLMIVLQGMFPSGAWGQLRTNQLDGRFEIGSFVDKHGVIGPDVAPDFLSSNGAKNLKSLTGGDQFDAEMKFSNKRIPFRGEKHVLITTNNHLSLAPGEDVGAWQRRLILIETKATRPERLIPNLGAQIIATERDAVFTKLMRGAWLALRELATDGCLTIPDIFRLAGCNVVRVTGSITDWVDTCISSGERAYTSEKLFELYSGWCGKKGATPVGKTMFYRDLRKLLAEHGINQCHNVMNTSARHCNGYRGLEVTE